MSCLKPSIRTYNRSELKSLISLPETTRIKSALGAFLSPHNYSDVKDSHVLDNLYHDSPDFRYRCLLGILEEAQEELKQRRDAQAALEKANEQLQAQIQQIEALQSELREQAARDPLTCLFNRRYLKDTLAREISRARREYMPVSIIIMDIDNFKNVNDLYGHNAGDKLLQAMGEMLKASIRAEDIVCRYGGEEFVIVMPGASLGVANERAELLRQKFEQMWVPYEGEQLHATISLGVAAYPIHGTDGEDALIRADRALYQAKQAGRNRVVIYRSDTKPFPIACLK